MSNESVLEFFLTLLRVYRENKALLKISDPVITPNFIFIGSTDVHGTAPSPSSTFCEFSLNVAHWQCAPHKSQKTYLALLL